MDEQPVAFATMARSPKSWLTSLTYGVSPQPEHAPENSNNGSSNCASLTRWVERRVRSASGSLSKNAQLAFSCSRIGTCGAMLTALSLTSVLFLTGQTSTQSAQPVQSSG